MRSIAQNIGKSLQRRYRRTVLFASLVLIAALLAYSNLLISSRQAALLADVKGESRQLKLSLEDTIDMVRGHLFGVQHSMESSLTQAIPAESSRSPGPLLDQGSLLVDPKATLDPKIHQRVLTAAQSFLPGTIATHKWSRMFQWTYFYDKAERWMLIYPQLPQDELFRVTKTRDMSAALRVVLDAGGTRPVFLAGPRSNPKRDMLWTPPYLDSAGKGMMVTLLAPIYQADEYIGAVGTDVTLNALTQTLREHAPAMGRSLVVDTSGNLLADNGSKIGNSETPVQLASVFPDLSAGLASIAPEDPAWLRYPLKGSSWTLLVHVPQAQLHSLALNALTPYLAMALLAFVLLLLLVWLLIRRYSWPALQLAEYVERCEQSADATAPDVPEMWASIFDNVATTARERSELLQRTQAQADELERKVAERTAELQSSNTALEATVASLQKAKQDLVRADRLGALGGMIAGVANELQGPLAQAEQSARRLRDGLESFKAQQARGLRKVELEAFVAQADAVGHQVGEDVSKAVDLLARFKQLALDQASDQSRRFRLREVADNVLAVMRPALSLQSCAVENRIPEDLEMDATAGTLGQLIHHLLTDALERVTGVRAARGIEITAGSYNDEHGEHVMLTVQDNGAAPTTTQAGLTIAEALAQDVLGGVVESQFAAGANRVSVHLPRSIE